MIKRKTALVSLFTLLAAPALADDPQPSMEEITVTAAALDKARQAIVPALGASDYTLDQKAIDSEPQGQERSLNQVLLQAPGFAEDSFGQLHLRNEHANLQYRIDDIIIPEGLPGFSQTFDTRFADHIDVLTGTLPAQYGYRTTGVVNITTKSGVFDQGSTLDLYGGSHATAQPSFELGGADGGFNYYGTGSYFHSSEGIENPAPTYNAIHDNTDQARGFAYLSQILSPEARISGIFGSSVDYFQIPNNPGQPAQYETPLGGSASSSGLNQQQVEYNHFGLIALQGSGDDFNYQFAPFVRYSETRFTPDYLGDLAFNGSADRSLQRATSSGVQFDASDTVIDNHTLRGGLFYNREQTVFNNTTTVFDTSTGVLNSFGNMQDSTVPETFTSDGGKVGNFYGIYGQDEWDVSRQVTINYGLRFDLINAYTNENQLSPRLNTVYKPEQGTTLHIGYARNFTPPPQELVETPAITQFNGTTRASDVPVNSPVKAEREHYFDAGGVQTLLPGLNLGIDTYYKMKRNMIDEGQFGESLVFAPFNYAIGRAYGVETTLNYRQDALTLYGNLAWGNEVGKTITSGQYFFTQDELNYIATHAIPTDHSQTWTASAGSSYRFKNSAGTLTPSLDLIYGSGLRSSPAAIVDPNGSHLPAYAQVNFGLAQAFDNAGGWPAGTTIRLDIVNVGDEHYELRDGTGVGVGAPQYGQRRTVFVGISKRF
jgi:hypothetical protein